MVTNLANLKQEIPSDLSRKLAELIASYEVAVDKMVLHEKKMEECFTANERYINAQIDKINLVLADFKDLMTETGAARWRISAENMLRQGKDHAKHLEEASLEIGKTLKESIDKFDRITGNTVKTVNEAVSSFRINDLKELVDKSAGHIKELSVSALERIYKVVKWFHWKNLIMALSLSLLIAIVMGLYINDEWPWEMHSSVVKQRSAGQALINAWPHLSHTDQAYIVQQIVKVNSDGNST